MAEMSDQIVASLDVGTTSLRCILYDQRANVLATTSAAIDLLYPSVNHVEIHPEALIDKVVEVVKGALINAGLTARQVKCMGISCQRSSFITWRKSTGKPFHNIITWRDLRADCITKELNKSAKLWTFRAICSLLHAVTRSRRFLTASKLKVMNTQVTPRLIWMLKNIPELREAVECNDAAFGTIDSWILYRLSGNSVHVTDVSHAACTGFFDPFVMDWSLWARVLFKVPHNILPTIFDTSTHFCDTDKSFFGSPIRITASAADQSASLFGTCSFNKGDIKITLGTGTFIDINTGDKPHSSISGLYPLVGWRIKGKTTFMAEGASNDAGTVVKWAEHIGLIQSPNESSDMAKSVQDTDGVYFIPSFSGLQAPVNDGLAAAGMIGIKPTTTRCHIVRALLESIAYRAHQLFEIAQNETDIHYTEITVDGGVSQNDFITQLIADLSKTTVTRASSPEMSALGAAFLAGVAAGVWKIDELCQLLPKNTLFSPIPENNHSSQKNEWQRAVTRFLQWYKNDQ